MCNVIFLFVTNSLIIFVYVKLFSCELIHVISSCYLYLEVVSLFNNFVLYYFEFNGLLFWGQCRYVGNIHIQVTEPLLQEVFASTGPVEACKLIRKEKVTIFDNLSRKFNPQSFSNAETSLRHSLIASCGVTAKGTCYFK